MNVCDLPLIVEPDQLEAALGNEGLLVVDLCKPEIYHQYHVPGAMHLDYGQLIQPRRPAMGLPPDSERLTELFSHMGLTPETRVVAYDDEGGGRAARLLWTLELAGHKHYSLLNGGLHAWANERHPLSGDPVLRNLTAYPVTLNEAPLATREYVLEHLGDPDVKLLDARSPAEYQGTRVFAARGGHIPGAVNLEWTETMDTQRNLRLKDRDTLLDMLEVRGAIPSREIIVYCQTHHRSAHLYIVLRSLGYQRVRAYAGSWSEWGNAPDLPVE